MAKLEKILHGDFDRWLTIIEDGILHGSLSASFEDGSDYEDENCRVAVRVFERYSLIGSNRVSMNVTMFQKSNGDIMLSAITSGGSQAIGLKINTWGEEAFLQKLEEIL